MARPFRTAASRGVASVAITLAAMVGIAALGSSVGLPPLPEPLADLNLRLPVVFKTHMMASGLGLILLPWIFLLRHRPSPHRTLGRIGAGLLLVGAATALPSALQSEAVPLARLGFFTQGALCLVFLIGAVWAIRAGNRQRHAQLMLCASALVSGAIILRILMAAAMAARLPFDPTYAAAAWLSWVLPLAIVGSWPRCVRWKSRWLARTRVGAAARNWPGRPMASNQ